MSILKRKCSMCRSGEAIWPIHAGGKVCDDCKFSIEHCESQPGTKGKPKYVGREPMKRQKTW